MKKTIRSRMNCEIGQQVEGCTVLEKRIVIPPEPRERRLGVYEYVVEAPPAVEKPRASRRGASAPEPPSFTRSTPDEMVGRLIRRLPSR